VHYFGDADGGTDRTSVGLRLDDIAEREAFVYLLADLQMELEPGLAEVTHDAGWSLSTLGLPLGVYVQGVFPHMHRRGRTLELHARRPDGTDPRCLVRVPGWDFDAQQMVFSTRPAYLYPDDELTLTCTFDTTDDTEPVLWGEGTEDEMCLVGLVVTLF